MELSLNFWYEVYERPLPGRPIVFRTPDPFIVVWIPLRPIVRLVLFLLRLILIPGAIFIDRLNLKKPTLKTPDYKQLQNTFTVFSLLIILSDF